MKKTTILALASFWLALALPGLADARPPRGRGPGGPPHGPGGPPHGPGPGPEMIVELAQELGLSAKQKQQIRDIADDAHKQHAKLRADMEIAEIDLRRELDQDEPDAAKAEKLIDHLAGLEASARKLHVGTMLKIRKVLTKDQRAKLEAHHETVRRAMHERHRERMEAPEAPEPRERPAKPGKAPKPR